MQNSCLRMIAAHIIVSTMTTRAFGMADLFIRTLAHADPVIMQNGDRYHGKVVSVSTNALVLQSDVLGTVNLSLQQSFPDCNWK